jgi:hypothetical protein
MKSGIKACSVFVLSLVSAAAFAHPGHGDVVAVHGNGFGVWLMHQLYNKDVVLTLVVLAALVALTGGRLFRSGGSFRRRRSRG